MKRLIISIIAGLIEPLIYVLIIGPLTTDIENYRIRQLIDMPFRWPIFILYYFFPIGSFPIRNETVLLLYIIGCDMVLYALMTYFILWIISTLRKVQPYSDSPPMPSNTN